MNECYELSSTGRGEIDCADVDFVPQMRADVVKPLVKSFMESNGTECAQAEFFVDNFEMVEAGGNFDRLEHFDSSNIISFEIKLCH